MSRIVVVVPVLNRPANAQTVTDSLRSSRADARLLFICSPNDHPQIKACRKTGEDTVVAPFPLAGGDWARKINHGHNLSDEEFVLLGADDLRFHSGWDTHALRVADQTGAGVVGTNDMGNRQVIHGHHSTHPLVRRSYIAEHGTIDEPRKVLHEGYFHNWPDVELVETARSRDQWAFAKLARVEHLHPNWRKAAMDATYERSLEREGFEKDRLLLERRRRLWGVQLREAKRRGRRVRR